MDLVHCRADHSYPGQPLEVFMEGEWQKVDRVLDWIRIPEGVRYSVICLNGEKVILVYNQQLDCWMVDPG